MSERKNKKKELEEIRKIVEKVKAGEEDIYSLFEKVIGTISTPMEEITNKIKDMWIGSMKPKHSTIILSGEEYEELMRYFDEAKAIFGWDLRILFNCIRRDQEAYFSIKKGDFKVIIDHSLFLGRRLTVEFGTPRGSRKFKIYEEKIGGF